MKSYQLQALHWMVGRENNNNDEWCQETTCSSLSTQSQRKQMSKQYDLPLQGVCVDGYETTGGTLHIHILIHIHDYLY